MGGDVVSLPLEMGSGADREVQTLFADAWRRLVVIRLRNNACLAAHSAVTPITIQCVFGAGTLHVEQTQYALAPGVIVPVDAHVEHSVIAEPEIALLVTFFRQPTRNVEKNALELHKSEEALREAEERYHALVDNARDVIFTLTTEGVFSSLNRVFEEATGWSPEEWIGQSFISLLHPADLPKALEMWQQTLQGEAPPLFELQFTSKAGELIAAEILVSPRLQDGKVVSILGIARNVTERKRMEEAQRRAQVAEAERQTLEKEIAERKQIEERLRYRLLIEEALANASRLLVPAGNPDFKKLLRILGEAVGANRSYIFLPNKDGATLNNTHEWCDSNTAPCQERLQKLRPEDCPWLGARLGKGESVIVVDVSLFSEEASREKALCVAQGVKSFVMVPVQDENGNTIGTLGFDATEHPRSWSEEDVRLLRVVSEMLSSTFARRRAERALRAAERDYRAIFENAVEGIYRSSIDGRQLRANPALVKLNGYSSEEEMLPAVNDIATELYVDPHRRKEFKRILDEQGTLTEFESEVYRHKTRERIWISETARLVRDEKGTPLYYEGTVQDITTRRQTEEELRKREARLAAIFRTVNDVIVTLDLNHAITGVNRAITRVLGYKPEEVIGRSSDMLLTAESATVARSRTEQALRGEFLPVLFELDGIDQQGKLIPLEVSAGFLYENGAPVGLVGVLRDISLKKELQRQQADFLAMVTHDIKNPIHVILGYSELLLEDVQDEEQRTLLCRLRRNAFTVHSLVTNYLDLSKIESGHLTLARQPIAINTVLLHVGQQYEGEAMRRGLAFHLQLQDELPLIDADPLALERIFANLIHNALKFTPPQGRITIRSALDADAVVVMIEDSGPGISQEEIQALFEKYRQGMQTRALDGAGLGLFIVKALVEAHNGHVTVESTPGQGSRFSVVLPVFSLVTKATV